jgi:hypothetical protein
VLPLLDAATFTGTISLDGARLGRPTKDDKLDKASSSLVSVTGFVKKGAPA